MANQNMTTKYHEAASEIFKQDLQDRNINLTCEVCSGNNWNLNASVATPLFLENDGEVIKLNFDEGHPSLLAHCSNCGNTKWFSLSRLEEKIAEALNR